MSNDWYPLEVKSCKLSIRIEYNKQNNIFATIFLKDKSIRKYKTKKIIKCIKNDVLFDGCFSLSIKLNTNSESRGTKNKKVITIK